MAQQSNITVFDGAATPVSHTFTPTGVSQDMKLSELIADWEELLSSLPTYARAKIRTQRRLLKSGMWRVAVTVSVPVMESIGSQNAAGYTAAPKVAYVNAGSYVGYYHERATPAERRLVKQIVANLLNNVATSVAAATAGFADELISSNVAPS